MNRFKSIQQTSHGQILRPHGRALLVGVGFTTAAAHIGNNFTTYLIGGLIDRFGYTPVQMGAWSMVETLAYAAAMFGVARRAARLSPRLLFLAAGILVTSAQLTSALLESYAPLLLGRLVAGFGFGLANSALNLAAGRTGHPARAISIGIATQTVCYAFINVALPLVGERYGVAGMFCALAGLSAVFTLALPWLPGGPGPSERGSALAGRALAGRGDAGCGDAGRADADCGLRESALRKLGLDAVTADGFRVLAAMAMFTFGSLAIWPFMERAAHAIGLSAVQFGRFQSAATLLSAVGNMALAAVSARAPRTMPLLAALVACGCACAALTTVSGAAGFAIALIVFNISWFVTYPLLLGIAYLVDASGRLAVLGSAVWLLMMSLGSLATGVIAQVVGDYRAVGPMGMVICIVGALVIRPVARRVDSAR